ncbi:response regulator transcription factor [Halomonas ventosae]|uniref:response regulator transcription factor n=1 Tax=Halomonas ventosae TaxID=229007 RepID=UPI00105CA39F|nr:response regulator [Halomonas ventosae]
MNKKILVVEDNSHKSDKIINHIENELPACNVLLAKSFSSGASLALDGGFDIVIIDMSLPTFDRSDQESGGRNRPFGGRELARKIIRRKIKSKLIFITQYESFSDHGRTFTFSSLRDEVEKECGYYYCGFIMYDSSKMLWKSELSSSLERALK